MTFIVMAYIVMAFTVMTYVVMAYIVMAFTVMTFIVMAYIVMDFTVMAFTVMAYMCLWPLQTCACEPHSCVRTRARTHARTGTVHTG